MGYSIRRPESEEDRQVGGGGNYITLTDDEPKFIGSALFEGDPAKEEDGYFEYYEHWHPILKSVPCAGDDCPLCDDGDRPRLRAKTVWLVTMLPGAKSELDTPQPMIFTINSNLIKQLTELRHEGDKIKGRMFRVSRLDDRGNYSLSPKTAMLKATEIKAALTEGDYDLGEMTLTQLKGKMEKIKVGDALADDDEDTPRASSSKAKTKTTAKGAASMKGTAAKGKAAPEPDDEDEPEEDNDTPELGPVPDEAEDEVVTIVKLLKAKNQIVVSHDEWDEDATLWGTSELDTTEFAKGDSVVVTFAKDDDGDYVLSAIDETEAPAADPEEDPEDDPEENENEGELPDRIDEMTMVVTEVNANDSTIEVESDEEGLTFTLYFLSDTEIEFDDFSEGDKIIVTAVKDNVGDMVSEGVPEKVAAKKKAAPAKRGRK